MLYVLEIFVAQRALMLQSCPRADAAFSNGKGIQTICFVYVNSLIRAGRNPRHRNENFGDSTARKL